MNTFEENLLAFAAATKEQDIYDPEYKGGTWMHEAVETHETLEDWKNSAKNYNERKEYAEGEIAGLPFISWSSVQVRKGDTRRALSVIDFGEKRIALDFDLSYFN